MAGNDCAVATAVQKRTVNAAGNRQRVGGEIHYDEGVANRTEPEPCGFVRKGRSEASVGARAVDRAEGDARGLASVRLVRRGRSPWTSEAWIMGLARRT